MDPEKDKPVSKGSKKGSGKNIEVEVSKLTTSTKGKTPFGRSGHSCVQYNRKLYVFGGRLPKNDTCKITNDKFFGNRRNYSKEVWELCLETFEWKKLKCKGVEKIKELHAHVSFFDKKALDMYILGGSGFGGFVCDNVVFKLNLKSLEWKVVSLVKLMKKDLVTCVNCERHGHCGVPYRNKMYIFGGHVRTGVRRDKTSKQSLAFTKKKRVFYNDVIVFDPKAKTLTKLETFGKKLPKPRSFASSFFFGPHFMFVLFGFEMIGTNGHFEKYYGDCFCLNLKTGEWKEADLDGDIPHKRNRATVTKVAKGKFVMIGGNFYDGKKDYWFEDSYLITVKSPEKLVLKKISDKMIQISHHIATPCYSRGSIVLFGGEVKRKRPKDVYEVKFGKI